MEKILNLDYHEDRWTASNLSVQELIDFEDDIITHWSNGEIRGPVQLSNGNEEQLIKIFSKIVVDDWVFSTWRSHCHALLHCVETEVLKKDILDRKSITIVNKECKFYSSAFNVSLINSLVTKMSLSTSTCLFLRKTEIIPTCILYS